MSFSFNKTVFAGMIGAAFLAACGGGGGSSPANQAPVAVSITPTNAEGAVAYAYSGAQNLSNQSSIGTSILTGVSVATSNNGLLTASLQQLYKGLTVLPANSLVAGVVASGTAPCGTSGTISVTASEAVTGQISNGDGMSITANSCVENGVTENGTIKFTFSNLTNTIGATAGWGATLAINYVNFSEQSGGETLSANGDLTLGYQQTANAASITATESGSSLAMSLAGSAGTINRKLTAYSLTDTVTSGTTSIDTNYTVTGSSPALGNTNFTVATTAPFVSTGTYPSSGSMTVTAADKSSATLTAVDSTNVTIVITDASGKSTTINTTWAALNSLM